MSEQQAEEELLGNHTIGKIEFPSLPLENQINILWYCDESTLINVAQTNRGYFHLILGEDDESDEINAYRNTIWKVRLLGELNRLIDECNKNIIDNGMDTSLIHNLYERDLEKYVRNNLRVKEDRIRYSALLSEFKKKVHTVEKHFAPEVEVKGRILKNKSVNTWYSFMIENYRLSNPSNSDSYCSFEGYEIVINQYESTGNDWNLVFGIGGKYEQFGENISIAEFTPENLGVGFIVHCNQFKIRGSHVYEDFSNQFAKGMPQAKLGDRFAVKIDREARLIHFFKNGIHIVSVGDTISEIITPITYYPIISMCVDMGVTFYPLLQVDYPIKNEKTFLKDNFKFVF